MTLLRHAFFLILIVLLSPLKAQQLFPTTDGELNKYAATLSFKGNSITGIMMIKCDNEYFLGTLINEFGFSAFDFTAKIKNGKVKLSNVMPFINKWYIKKVIKTDLKQLILFDQGKKTKSSKHIIITREEDSIELQNTKYNIIYKFRLLPKTEDN